MNFFSIHRLSPRQSVTPEGYLLIEGVPIARTGLMVYGPGEVPIQPGPDGAIYVTREDDEVFRPETLASFNGKDITDEHPPEDVNPENWRALSRGIVFNARRGAGADSDLLLADFLVKDKQSIQFIRDRKRVEVSCGYDADYEELAPGKGRQRNIIGNHVALLDGKGRCGPRCATPDHAPKEGLQMATKDKKSAWAEFKDSIMKAFKAKDEAGFQATVASGDAAGFGVSEPTETGDMAHHVHVHVPTMDEYDHDEHMEYRAKNDADHEDFRKRLGEIEAFMGKARDAMPALAGVSSVAGVSGTPGMQTNDAATRDLEARLSAEAPEGKGALAAKAKDSEFLADAHQEAVSFAEILSPGIQVPPYERAAEPKKTLDTICGLRRKALDSAAKVEEIRPMLEALNGGRPIQLDQMTCDAVRQLFRGAAVARKTAVAARDAALRTNPAAVLRGNPVKAGVKSIAELNAAHTKHYAANAA